MEEKKGNYVKIEGELVLENPKVKMSQVGNSTDFRIPQDVVNYLCTQNNCDEDSLLKVLDGKWWVVIPPARSIVRGYIIIPIGGNEK